MCSPSQCYFSDRVSLCITGWAGFELLLLKPSKHWDYTWVLPEAPVCCVFCSQHVAVVRPHESCAYVSVFLCSFCLPPLSRPHLAQGFVVASALLTVSINVNHPHLCVHFGARTGVLNMCLMPVEPVFILWPFVSSTSTPSLCSPCWPQTPLRCWNYRYAWPHCPLSPDLFQIEGADIHTPEQKSAWIPEG